MLKDIIKLPDVQLIVQPQSPTFELQSKTSSPQTFTAHHEDVKIKWLREIAQHANDPLALHEHTVDDLRIDPTQIKADTDTEAFRLPPRIDAHEPESVRPSEVAKDHYLPHPEKLKVAAEVTSDDKQESKVEKRITSTTSSAVTFAKSATSTIESTNNQQPTKVLESKSNEQSVSEIKISEQKSFAETKIQQETAGNKATESKLTHEQLANTDKTNSANQQLASKSSAIAPSPTITKVSQQQEKTVQSIVIDNKSTSIKEPSPVAAKNVPVENKTEYIVTEPQSIAPINTITDIGTRAQIQGKRTDFKGFQSYICFHNQFAFQKPVVVIISFYPFILFATNM